MNALEHITRILEKINQLIDLDRLAKQLEDLQRTSDTVQQLLALDKYRISVAHGGTN